MLNRNIFFTISTKIKYFNFNNVIAISVETVLGHFSIQLDMGLKLKIVPDF
jgi:hypothetical protein